MKRRGFLQAIFGAAAIPAAVKAAEAFDALPDLPVGNAVSAAAPMPRLYTDGAFTAYATACAYVSWSMGASVDWHLRPFELTDDE